MQILFQPHLHNNISPAKDDNRITKMRRGKKSIAGNPNVVDNNNSCRDSSSMSNPGVRMNARSRPPPFLVKLYAMVMDPETDETVSWSSSRQSFIIWDRNKFSSSVLPMYFRHKNFPSFSYQLNNYGFNKISWEHYEFANPLFVKGREDLLMRIRRKNEDNRGVDQGNENLDGRSLMEATMEILRSEQEKLEEQLQKIRGKQEYLVDEFATIKDDMKAILEDQENLNTALVAHTVHQYVTEQLEEHLRDRRGNDGTKEPVSIALCLASPDNHSSRDSPDQQDPTLNQTEVKLVANPTDNSEKSIQAQKTNTDDSSFWKKIMEDDSS